MELAIKLIVSFLLIVAYCLVIHKATKASARSITKPFNEVQYKTETRQRPRFLGVKKRYQKVSKIY